MQFKIILNKKKGGILPVNYRYDFYTAVSDLIVKVVDHYPVADPLDFRRRVAKSFTFSNLNFDSYEIHHRQEVIAHRGKEVSLEIRFLIEDEEKTLIEKALQGQKITLGKTNYQIVTVQAVPPIDFQDVMVYRCKCPISLASSCPSGDTCFLSPRDESFKNFLKIDLIKRLLQCSPEVSDFNEDDLDQYCPEFQFELLSEPKEKGFNVKANDAFQSVVGYQFDFQLKASPVLHEIGFYKGFGLQQSMGLGFVEVIA